MKRKRFEQLHRAALRWPADRFHYVGIGLDPANEKEAWDGEVNPNFCRFPFPG
jgi:hypothetical protein